MSGLIPDRFQLLFKEHYPSVVRKILCLVADRSAAEDLAQEAFLRLYRNPPDNLDSVGAWLHRVSTRLAYDYLRQRSRREERDALEMSRQTDDQWSAPSNEHFVIRNWERDVVKRVLQKLSERDREALLLKEQGYSYAEIAERLEVNPKIVGSLIMRATARFKKTYLREEVSD